MTGCQSRRTASFPRILQHRGQAPGPRRVCCRPLYGVGGSLSAGHGFLRRSMMVCCSSLAASDPTPPRPVVHRARSEGVEPWSFVERGRRRAHKSASTGSRRSVPHCSMQRRYPALGSCVRVSARVNQIVDDRPLASRVTFVAPGSPMTAACSGSAPAPVAGADVSAARNQITGKLDIVRERARRAARYRLRRPARDPRR